MSYRSFKHLLGETSLERKCRFIFGLGILVLVSGSFFWYGQKTESLVLNQTTQSARMAIEPTLLNIHYRALGNSNFESVLDVLSKDLKPVEEMPKYTAKVINPFKLKEQGNESLDEFERVTLAKFLESSTVQEAARKSGSFKEPA